MKTLLKSEQFLLFAASVAALSRVELPFHWAWLFLIFWVPDLGMLGYLAGNKIGATIYNVFHHQGLAAGLAVGGWMAGVDSLLVAGLLMLGHAAFDRVMGYGLKYNTSFNDTHLGVIGQMKKGKTG